MFAVIVNTIAIIAGTALGLMLRRGIPDDLSDAIMKALGLCTIVIGVKGSITEENISLLIVATVTGLFLGELIKLEDRINNLTEQITNKLAEAGEAAKMARAFVTSCLIMNVGAMTIVGSLEAGLRGAFDMLYTKSLLDFVAGIMLGATMGLGVMGSALFTLIFQGAIVLLAEYIAPFLTDALIASLSAVGSIMILGIGFNMIGLTNFRILNYLPSLLVVPIIYLVLEHL